jgi:hypothetical protein
MRIFVIIFIFVSQITFADMVISNQNRLNLISQKENIIGVEILVTQKNKILLRFVDRDVNPANDFIVEFLGKEIIVGQFGEFWAEYTKLGFTFIERSIIPTNISIRETLIKNLELYFSTEATIKKPDADIFSFLSLQSEFTRYLATKIPLPKRPRYNDVIVTKPIYDTAKLIKYFSSYGITAYPKLRIETIDSLKNKVERIFLSDNKTLETKEGWPENSVEIIEYEFRDIDIKRILVLYKNIPSHIAEELERKHSFKTGAKLDEVLGVKDIPDQMYQLCIDKECAQVLKGLGHNIWGSVLWEKEMSFLKNVSKEVRLVYDYARIQGHIKSIDLKSIVYIKHFELILE